MVRISGRCPLTPGMLVWVHVGRLCVYGMEVSGGVDGMSGFAQSSCWDLGAFFGTVPTEGWLFLLLVVVPHQHRIITVGCGNDAGRLHCDGLSMLTSAEWSLRIVYGCSRFAWFGLLLVACSVSWPHGSCWVRLAASSAWTTDNSAAMLKGGWLAIGLASGLTDILL
ncbi:hypothetical protein U1Q18_018515 [Sarracenia purpurea var. burkii]